VLLPLRGTSDNIDSILQIKTGHNFKFRYT